MLNCKFMLQDLFFFFFYQESTIVLYFVVLTKIAVFCFGN